MRPVDELTIILWAYSTHISNLDQVDGLLETMQRRATSISWFLRSTWLLDWGWKAEDRLAVAPIRVQNSLQKTEENCGPRSETTSTGRPQSLR